MYKYLSKNAMLIFLGSLPFVFVESIHFKVGTHWATSRSDRYLRQVASCVLLQNKALRQGACSVHAQLIRKSRNVN